VNTRIVALPGLVLAVGLAAQAQAPAPNKVGVIQVQSAIVNTRDGQKAVSDLESRLAPRKSDLEKKQNEIRELQEKLQRGGNAMADSAKQDLTRTIDQKTKSYNRQMEDAQAEFQEEQRKLLDDLGQKMMKVIDSYAQTHGFTVVLDVSNPNTPVLYASNSVDITKDIIDMYDKSTPAPATSQAPKPAASGATASGGAPAKPAASSAASSPAAKKP
jgi:outer membrane protein